MKPPLGDLLVRRLLGASGWLLAGSAGTRVLSVVQGLLLARFLGPLDYGVFVLVTAYPLLVTKLLDTRSWEATIRHVNEFHARDQHDKARATIKWLGAVDLLVSVFAFLVIALSSNLVARLLTEDTSTAGPMILYGVIVLAGAPLGISQGLLRLSGDFRSLARQEFLATAAQVLAFVVLLPFGPTLHQLILVLVGGAVVRTTLAILRARKALIRLDLGGWLRSPVALIRDERNRILRFVGTTNAFAVLKGVQRNADSLLVGALLGPGSVGIYRLARNISDLVDFPVAPLYQVSYPEFSRAWSAGDFSDLWRMLRISVLISMVAGGLAVVGIVLFTGPAISIFVGDQFLPAVSVTRLLGIGVFLNVVIQFHHALLVAAGRVGQAVASFGIGLLVQALTFLILIPLWGLVGAATGFIAFGIVRAAFVLRSYVKVRRDVVENESS